MSDQKQILIPCIYASTSGHTEAVVEFVAQRWEASTYPQISCPLHKAEQTQADIFETSDLFLMGVSTWRHGDVNPYFRPLMDQMKEIDLSGKKAFFIGLGDYRYEHVLFCGGLDQLVDRWEDRGGQSIKHHLKIHGEPFDQLDTVVTAWADHHLANIRAH